MAVEMGCEFYYAAEGVGLEEGVEGEEVGVPAAVFFWGGGCESVGSGLSDVGYWGGGCHGLW